MKLHLPGARSISLVYMTWHIITEKNDSAFARKGKRRQGISELTTTMTHDTDISTDTVALVPAAGSGYRLGLGPKAFLEIGGRTLLEHVVRNLVGQVERILVGAPPDHIERAHRLVGDRAEVRVGGSTRQESISLLFAASTEGVVLIHNVGQPFATRELIGNVVLSAKRHGAAASFLPAQVPVGHVVDGFVTQMTSRKKILLPYTPQAFHRDILQEALQYAREHGTESESILQLVLSIGRKVRFVPGEETNVKLTTALDWEVARKVIAPHLGWV